MDLCQHSDFRERFVFIEDLGRWVERDAAEQLFASREMVDSLRPRSRDSQADSSRGFLAFTLVVMLTFIAAICGGLL